MNEHDSISKTLLEQLRTLQQLFYVIHLAPLSDRTPVEQLSEASWFSGALIQSDSYSADNWILSDPRAAESFLQLANDVVNIYSKQRVLTHTMFPNSDRPFSRLATLVQIYIEHIDIGSPNPFEGTARIKRKS